MGRSPQVVTRHIPNSLTVFRIVLIPVLVVLYYWGMPNRELLVTGVFVVAAITDWLDGFLARSMGTTSKLGAFLAPVADKLIVSTALVLLVSDLTVLANVIHPMLFAVAVCIIIGREIVISALREWMAEMGERGVVKVGILGSGNIGTDLLVKSLRSDLLEPTLFVGRNMASPGMRKANELGVRISDQSIGAFPADPKACDLVFDCTSALAHQEHWPVFEKLGLQVVDMTPSNIGEMCVPAINLLETVPPNINMVTCGGQASVPIANAILDRLAW